MAQVMVDDQDARVIYRGAWEHQQSVVAGEFNQTISGARPAGSTATLNFVGPTHFSDIVLFVCLTYTYLFLGTKITVFGTQGSINVDGQPTTTYAIDGVVVATYAAPMIAPGYVTTGTIFFKSQTLADGNHTLVITTTNGTLPNRYLLDYFQYTASPFVSSSSISSSSNTPSSSTRPTSNNAAPVSSPSTLASSNTSEASSRNKVGPIVGGVLGGIAFLMVAALLLFICIRKRRSRGNYSRPADIPSALPGESFPISPPCSSVFTQFCVDVTPFPVWQQENRAPYSGGRKVKPSTTAQDHNPSTPSPLARWGASSPLSPAQSYQPPTSVPSSSALGAIASIDSAPQLPHAVPQRRGTRPLPAEPAARGNPVLTSLLSKATLSETSSSPPTTSESDPIMRQHLDSGIRLPAPVVDIPPVYTQT